MIIYSYIDHRYVERTYCIPQMSTKQIYQSIISDAIHSHSSAVYSTWCFPNFAHEAWQFRAHPKERNATKTSVISWSSTHHSNLKICKISQMKLFTAFQSYIQYIYTNYFKLYTPLYAKQPKTSCARRACRDLISSNCKALGQTSASWCGQPNRRSMDNKNTHRKARVCWSLRNPYLSNVLEQCFVVIFPWGT